MCSLGFESYLYEMSHMIPFCFICYLMYSYNSVDITLVIPRILGLHGSSSLPLSVGLFSFSMKVIPWLLHLPSSQSELTLPICSIVFLYTTIMYSILDNAGVITRNILIKYWRKQQWSFIHM